MPSAMWLLWIELKVSGLVAGTFYPGSHLASPKVSGILLVGDQLLSSYHSPGCQQFAELAATNTCTLSVVVCIENVVPTQILYLPGLASVFPITPTTTDAVSISRRLQSLLPHLSLSVLSSAHWYLPTVSCIILVSPRGLASAYLSDLHS